MNGRSVRQFFSHFSDCQQEVLRNHHRQSSVTLHALIHISNGFLFRILDLRRFIHGLLAVLNHEPVERQRQDKLNSKKFWWLSHCCAEKQGAAVCSATFTQETWIVVSVLKRVCSWINSFTLSSFLENSLTSVCERSLKTHTWMKLHKLNSHVIVLQWLHFSTCQTGVSLRNLAGNTLTSTYTESLCVWAGVFFL